ncbi:MFS transporter [Luteococcus peritonei]
MRSVTNRRVLLGSLSGSAIEWYDFLLYGTVAPIIFAKQFFPQGDPFVQLMAAYFGQALTFLIRPLGGVFFAHIGDRVGRKKTLVMTLTIMGLGTVAIGLLPTYAQIGMAAPVLLYLFRIIQGLAIGGEWGGALLLAYEYAPRERRGFFGSMPQLGVTAGLLLGNAAVLLATLLPGDAFDSWGWRVPFVFSIVLVALGLWIRGGLDETPAFRALQETGQVEKTPLATTLREHWRAVLLAVGAKAAETAPFYILVTFIVGYATSKPLSYTRSDVLTAVLVGAAVATAAIPLMGILSDRLGRRPVYMAGVLLFGLSAFAYFPMVNSGKLWLFVLASVMSLGLAWAPVTATLGTMMSETFTANIRYTGVTLGYQIGAALFSGTAPMIALWLQHRAGGSWLPVALYWAGLTVLSFCSAWAARHVAVRENQLA